MSESGLAAVANAAGIISKKDHEAAVETARKAGEADGLKTGHDVGFKEGLAAGAETERKRVAGIEAAALPGHEKLLAELKADGSVTPEAAAMRFINAEKAARAGHADAIRNVEDATRKVQSVATATTTQPAPAANTPEGWKAEYEKSPALQEEFGSADRYVTYQQGVANGRIRRLTQRSA